jgi:hypothetical protein
MFFRNVHEKKQKIIKQKLRIQIGKGVAVLNCGGGGEAAESEGWQNKHF